MYQLSKIDSLGLKKQWDIDGWIVDGFGIFVTCICMLISPLECTDKAKQLTIVVTLMHGHDGTNDHSCNFCTVAQSYKSVHDYEPSPNFLNKHRSLFSTVTVAPLYQQM